MKNFITHINIYMFTCISTLTRHATILAIVIVVGRLLSLLLTQLPHFLSLSERLAILVSQKRYNVYESMPTYRILFFQYLYPVKASTLFYLKNICKREVLFCACRYVYSLFGIAFPISYSPIPHTDVHNVTVCAFPVTFHFHPSPFNYFSVSQLLWSSVSAFTLIGNTGTTERFNTVWFWLLEQL